jgi:KDO2-lipid IV(A) lauroyltransferase
VRPRKIAKFVYRPVLALALRALAWTVRRLPRRLALACGEALGGAAFRVCGRDRRIALENLTRAFGRSRPRRELAAVARECFRNTGRSLFETLRLPAMSEEELLSVVDADSFRPAEEARARGKGLLVLSAHLASWEVLGAYVAIRFGGTVHGMGRELYYGPYDDLLTRIRRSKGVETVYRDRGARPALAVLRDNRPLVILADQDVKRLDGVFVEFFGRPARTPTGPAAIARASGAGMVPFLMTWKGRRHHLHVLPEIELVRTRDKQADIIENTRRWTRAVEGVIRRYPEQWVWFHRRWKSAASRADEGRP